MLTSSSELVPFHVEADDDHRDLVVVAKGKSYYDALIYSTRSPSACSTFTPRDSR
jgi:hypothetical protein